VPNMPKCTFCGMSAEKGTGKMFVYASGKIAYFCSGKCETNLIKLKRKPLKTKWTALYRKEHKKDGSSETKKEFVKEEKKPEIIKKVEEKKEEPVEVLKEESTEKVEEKKEENITVTEESKVADSSDKKTVEKKEEK
jgi:large subunit ribosomal protein L24e